MTASSAKSRAFVPWKKLELPTRAVLHCVERVRFAQIAVVDWPGFPPRVRFHVGSSQDPGIPEPRQPVPNLPGKIRIAPRPAGVVNADASILFGFTIRQSGGRLRDLFQAHPNVGEKFSRRSIRRTTLGIAPFDGISRFRFKGSSEIGRSSQPAAPLRSTS
jgi:hypothetical protein